MASPTLKYPMECASIVRLETFAVTNALARAKAADGAEPLKFHAPYSRFIFAIINEDRKSVIANIPVRVIARMTNRTQFAEHHDFEQALKKTPNSELSSAYTVKITSGRFKGKTPAEILLEDSANAAALNQQYLWLQSNLEKYPYNGRQMEAIMDAAKLFQSGALKPESVVGTPPIVIYDAPVRPLSSRKREDGKWLVYSVSVRYFCGDAYPVEIRIENYYAPVIQKADKTLNVKISQAVDKQINKMLLTAEEWDHVLGIMNANIRVFELLNGQVCYQEAITENRKNKELSAS